MGQRHKDVLQNPCIQLPKRRKADQRARPQGRIQIRHCGGARLALSNVWYRH